MLKSTLTLPYQQEEVHANGRSLSTENSDSTETLTGGNVHITWKICILPIISVETNQCLGGRNRHLFSVLFRSFNLDKRLCVVDLLEAYIKRTAPPKEGNKAAADSL